MPRRAKPWFRSAENVWYATHNGRQVCLGVRGKGNEAAAWRAWELLRAGQSLDPAPVTSPHVLPAPVPRETAPSATVQNVIDAFLADAVDRVKSETLSLYRLFLTKFAKTHGAIPAAALTCPVAEAYSRRPNWNDSTRSAFLATLARAFYYAERSRIIDRTPLIGLRKPPMASRAADAMVTGEQHAKLSVVAPPYFRQFLEMLYLTGCRPAEAAQLTAADIDWDAKTATVRQHKTVRKGRRRVLYLPPNALAMLSELAVQRPDGTLFRNRIGRPWTRAAIGMAMRKAGKVAGLSGKIAYGYRHAFATDALANGLPDAHVAELLGHASTAMLHRHYSHLASRTPGLRRRESEGLDKRNGHGMNPLQQSCRPDRERSDPALLFSCDHVEWDALRRNSRHLSLN
jgi:integrase/recombinase XerD